MHRPPVEASLTLWKQEGARVLVAESVGDGVREVGKVSKAARRNDWSCHSA